MLLPRSAMPPPLSGATPPPANVALPAPALSILERFKAAGGGVDIPFQRGSRARSRFSRWAACCCSRDFL